MTRVVLILAVISASAFANPQQAKARFKQGKAYQDAGAYVKAAEEYKAAYDLDPRPEMLFNIAQAYRLAGERQLAIDYFKKYLDAQPGGAGADEARGHVATLTKELDELAAKQPKPPEPTPAPPPPTPTPPPPEELVEVRGPRSLRIAGLATAGVGMIAVGLGVKFAFDARSAADALSQHTSGAWTDAEEATYLAGERANRNMIISYVVGGVLVGTGAVLYWRGARTTLVPVATTTSASLAVAGQF